MSDFLALAEKRRSVYSLSQEASISDAQLTELLRALIAAMPTAYNMQSTRLVLLTQNAHQKLWSIVLETLRQRIAAEKFASTEKKIAGFAAAHGSLLFFDDSAVTQQFMKDNPRYAENFEPWALQQNGMLQFAAWSLLAEQGMGASLQHYNPIIDDEVKSTFCLPASWTLLAQMPFGAATAAPDPKDIAPVDTRFRSFNS
ncbi:MAG: nitroreductase family protein [Oscillospiraceae bacterium]